MIANFHCWFNKGSLGPAKMQQSQRSAFFFEGLTYSNYILRRLLLSLSSGFSSCSGIHAKGQKIVALAIHAYGIPVSFRAYAVRYLVTGVKPWSVSDKAWGMGHETCEGGVGWDTELTTRYFKYLSSTSIHLRHWGGGAYSQFILHFFRTSNPSAVRDLESISNGIILSRSPSTLHLWVFCTYHQDMQPLWDMAGFKPPPRLL